MRVAIATLACMAWGALAVKTAGEETEASAAGPWAGFSLQRLLWGESDRHKGLTVQPAGVGENHLRSQASSRSSESREDPEGEEGDEKKKNPLGEIRIATWNVLSISKCEKSANGLPGMEEKAFKRHQKLEGDEVCDKDDDELRKSVNTSLPNPKTNCASAWIAKQVSKLFEEHNLGMLFLQEIDYPMLLGLDALKGNDLMKMPVAGDTAKMWSEKDQDWTQVVQQLKEEKEGALKWKAPAQDYPFIIWDDKQVETPVCKHVGRQLPIRGSSSRFQDMSRMGLCTVYPKGMPQLKWVILAMQADSGTGFTGEQAIEIDKTSGGEEIDLVIGDLNLFKRKKVESAAANLNGCFKWPSEFGIDEEKAKEGLERDHLNSIYTIVHPYRMLVKLLKRSGIRSMKVPGPNGEDSEEYEPAMCRATDDENLYGPEQGGKGLTMPRKAARLQAREKLIELCDAVYAVNLDISEDEEKLKKWKNEPDRLRGDRPEPTEFHGQLPNLFVEMFDNHRDVWEEVSNPLFDWQKFPELVGLDEDLMVTKKGQKFLEPFTKRPDWVLHDKCTFTKATVSIPGELDLNNEVSVFLSRKSRGRNAPEPPVLPKIPNAKLASDHLPVIAALYYEKVRGYRFSYCKQNQRIITTPTRHVKRAWQGMKSCCQRICDFIKPITDPIVLPLMKYAIDPTMRYIKPYVYPPMKWLGIAWPFGVTPKGGSGDDNPLVPFPVKTVVENPYFPEEHREAARKKTPEIMHDELGVEDQKNDEAQERAKEADKPKKRQ